MGEELSKHGEAGWLARAGCSTASGEGNSFPTPRDAGAGSLLRQMVPVEIKSRHVFRGARDIYVSVVRKITHSTPAMRIVSCPPSKSKKKVAEQVEDLLLLGGGLLLAGFAVQGKHVRKERYCLP